MGWCWSDQLARLQSRLVFSNKNTQKLYSFHKTFNSLKTVKHTQLNIHSRIFLWRPMGLKVLIFQIWYYPSDEWNHMSHNGIWSSDMLKSILFLSRQLWQGGVLRRKHFCFYYRKWSHELKQQSVSTLKLQPELSTPQVLWERKIRKSSQKVTISD